MWEAFLLVQPVTGFSFVPMRPPKHRSHFKEELSNFHVIKTNPHKDLWMRGVAWVQKKITGGKQADRP